MRNDVSSRGVSTLALHLCLFLTLLIAPLALAQAPERELNLLAMGDWGEGKPAQTSVADAMAAYARQQKPPIDAMLLAGDNFYVPLADVNDPVWQTLFERMYDPAALNFPFYASLGNHDYDQNKYRIELEYARVHPESRWKFPAKWYRIDLPAPVADRPSRNAPGERQRQTAPGTKENAPLVTVLMLDSNQPFLTPIEWRQQINWLDQELANPHNAPWVICCAHHPLFSNGAAADNGILQRDWGALFKRYHVDFYLCGHEHNLQHLEIPNWSTSFVLAGGGGAHAHPMLRDNRGPFSRSIYGFVHFEITPTLATVRYIGVDDKPLHIFERTKAGETRVLMSTRSDSPIDKPLEAILGIYGKLRPQTQPTTHPATQTSPTTEP
jgi:tartrate-resistant acid phosphatase type 5